MKAQIKHNLDCNGAILFKVLAFMCLIGTLSCSGTEIPKNITRRLSNDIIYFRPGYFESCNVDDNFTYIVDERRCESSQELINACRFAIVPANSSMLYQIAVYIITKQSRTSLKTANAAQQIADAVIITQHRQTTLTSFSDCHIDSLEVYRGGLNIIEISHVGFSITDNGLIEIDKNITAYDVEEFKGELFRMNLSCSGEERGCLFLKVLGMTSVTKAKFKGIVHGTVVSDGTVVNDDKEDGNASSLFNAALIYAMAGTGGAIFVLIFLATSIIITVCIRHHKNTNKENGSWLMRKRTTKEDHAVCERRETRFTHSPKESPVQLQCNGNPSYKQVSVTYRRPDQAVCERRETRYTCSPRESSAQLQCNGNPSYKQVPVTYRRPECTTGAPIYHEVKSLESL